MELKLENVMEVHMETYKGTNKMITGIVFGVITFCYSHKQWSM